MASVSSVALSETQNLGRAQSRRNQAISRSFPSKTVNVDTTMTIYE